MRRIVAFNRVTADGYFATPDGKLDFAVPDDEVDQAGAAGIPEADTILFGRKTYDAFESFWPHALDDAKTARDPHTVGRHSPAMREMAVFINAAKKVVFSRTRKEVAWKNSELVRDFDPEKIEAMKRAPGKAIMIFGSGQITSQLTQHGLIDDYLFVLTPVLLGSGRSLVSGVTQRLPLVLAEVKQYRTGNVTLHYTRRDQV
jgi:dihydrofolate reductase